MSGSALNRAFNYLARRDHSTLELKNKLKKKGYPVSEIDEAIDRLKSLGYLDDEKFAVDFVRYCQKFRRLGPFRIQMELEHKGITGEVKKRAMTHYDLQQEKENIRILSNSRLVKGKIENSIYRFLIQKGYSSSSAAEALGGLKT